MFLETMTVLLAALVLVVKYATSKHIAVLHRRKLEAENLCYQNEQRFKQCRKERRAAEEQEKEVQKEVHLWEGQVAGLKEDLSEQEDRNRELEEQIEL